MAQRDHRRRSRVGKSVLLKAAADQARRQGRRVLSVAPTQFEQGLPFAGLAELLGRFPKGAEQALPGPQQRALAVALQRAEPAGGEVDALAVPLAVRGLLTRLCESEPVALLIDDLQWLDQASVGSLGFALRGVSADERRGGPGERREPVAGPGDRAGVRPRPRPGPAEHGRTSR
ncbi:ATP-binding protein [Spirillospora sp. NPDC047418]